MWEIDKSAREREMGQTMAGRLRFEWVTPRSTGKLCQSVKEGEVGFCTTDVLRYAILEGNADFLDVGFPYVARACNAAETRLHDTKVSPI